MADTATETPPAGPAPVQVPSAPSQDKGHAYWANLYSGLDGVENRLGADQKAAFGTLSQTPDPMESKAKVINQSFLQSEMPSLSNDALTQNWQGVKAAYAKVRLGIEQPNITDKAFYAAVSKQMDAPAMKKDNVAPEGWGGLWWAATHPSDVLRTMPLVHAAFSRPMLSLPEAPKGLPDINLPYSIFGISNPSTLGSVYNVLKPQLESLSSPENMMTMRAGAVLHAASLTSQPAKVAFRSMQGVFAALMGHQAVTEAPEVKRILADPKASNEDKAKAVVNEVVPVGLTLLTALDVVGKTSPEALKTVEKGHIEEAPAKIIDAAGEVADPEKREVMVHAANQIADVAGVPATDIKTEPLEDEPAKETKPGQAAAKLTPAEPTVSGTIPAADNTDTYGIAARVREQRALAGDVEPVEPGQGIAPEESIALGRSLLAEGKSPEAALDRFEKSKSINSDDIALVRAKGEELAKAAADSARQFGPNSKEYIEAANEDSAWARAIKPMQTEWHKIGQAQQGETDLDTGDYHSLREEFKRLSGRDFTPTESEKAEKVAKGVRDAEDGVAGAKTKVLNELKEKAAKAPPRQLSYEELKARRIASLEKRIKEVQKKLATGDLTPEDTAKKRPSEEEIEVLEQERDALNEKLAEARRKSGGSSPDQVLINQVDQLEKTIAAKKAKLAVGDVAPKKGAVNRPAQPALEQLKQENDDLNRQIADARKAAPKTETEKRVKQLEGQIAKVEDQLKNEAPFSRGKEPPPSHVLTPETIELEKRLNDLKEEREYLRDRLQPKEPTGPAPGSPEDIWARAKDYLEAGEDDFDDIRHKIAADTGMPVNEVTKILAGPKKLRVITNEMYSKMAQRRQLVQQANQWLKAQAMPGWQRMLTKVPAAFFKAKVFGHGTVGMITHAGMNMFDPTEWGTYWPEFVKQFKLIGWHDNGAFHERAMQDLERDPNYTTARRAGLANVVDKEQDDYQKGFVSKLGLAGNRGFDALKIYRQARFNQTWDTLPDSMQDKEHAEMIADAVNHSTGYVKAPMPSGLSTVFFAPKLEASRWATMVGDTAKSARIFAAWDKATPAERMFATMDVKRKAIITGTYLSLVAANQGLLTATGSKQKVNFDDPRKPDWLAFKAGGFQVGIVGPMLSEVRLLANLFHAAVMPRTGAETKDSRAHEEEAFLGNYARGKLSPFAADAADVASQADFQGRPLPFSKDKVPSYLAKEGKGKYTYAEYIAQQALPIPLEEAVKEVWANQGMSTDRMNKFIKASIIGVATGATGARVEDDTANEKKPDKGKSKAKLPSFQPDLPARDISHSNR